jgi:hypothetical protein
MAGREKSSWRYLGLHEGQVHPLDQPGVVGVKGGDLLIELLVAGREAF